jgi:hypothetical protein
MGGMRDGVVGGEEISQIRRRTNASRAERDDEAKNERGVQPQELINKEKVTVGYINTGVALASQRFFSRSQDSGHEQCHRQPDHGVQGSA